MRPSSSSALTRYLEAALDQLHAKVKLFQTHIRTEVREAVRLKDGNKQLIEQYLRRIQRAAERQEAREKRAAEAAAAAAEKKAAAEE